eukprot:jgi/Bigna1/125940/aug1.1_g648
MVPSRDVWSRLVVAVTACTIVFLVGLHSNTPARVRRAYGGRDSARQRMAVDFFVPPRSRSGTPPSPLRQRRCSSRRRLLPATLASKADSTPSPLSSTKSSSTAVEGETGKNQREAQGAAKAAPPLRPVRNEAYHAMRWELSQRISLESPRLVKCIFQTGPHAYVARIGSKESTTGTSAKFTTADQDPVQIMAELSDGKQPLLFLPGVDGSASTLRFQHEDLTRNYDVWVEFVDPQDRSSFADRVAITSNLVRNLQTSTEMNMMEKKENPKASSDARPLIMGESFGGLHALGVQAEASCSDRKAFESDFVMPSMEVRENATAYVQTIRQLAAPAFFSTNKDGKIDPGVGNVPLPSDSAVGGTMTNDDVGVLLVGNHQLYGLDLGDPFGGPANIFKQFGAVPVSGRNLDTLMRERKPSLLFPGGVREVYHKKGEDYKVIWPEKGEFVRAAAKHNATIVPFSAIGIADSFRMVADSNDILNAPIVGDYVQQRASLLPKARDNETFVAPLSIPQLPARFYFLFGKPVETFNLDYKDKEECQRVYESIRRDVEVGIDMLLAERDKDPFREYPARLFYETVNQKPAPLPDLFTNKDKE